MFIRDDGKPVKKDFILDSGSELDGGITVKEFIDMFSGKEKRKTDPSQMVLGNMEKKAVGKPLHD